MKRYTLRALIHDAKVFNQLRLEYRRTKKDRRKELPLTGCRVICLGQGDAFALERMKNLNVVLGYEISCSSWQKTRREGWGPKKD